MKSIIPTLGKARSQGHRSSARFIDLRRTVLIHGQHRLSPLLRLGLRRTAVSLRTGQKRTSVRHNLRWFWWDGLFAQASESIVVAYLSLFVLALGASRTQIGFMSALSNLSAALLLLPGAIIAERLGRRKLLCLWSGGGFARLTLLLLALVPLAFAGPVATYVAIGLVVIRSAFANLTVPAWVSLTADIVPLSQRGRYFSSRNIAMGVAGMGTAFLVGQMITRLGSSLGYQLAMGVAFGIGMASTFSFARLQEPPASAPEQLTVRGSRLPLLHRLRAQPDFLAFCAVAALWNFSLNIAGPFFSVYLVENLKATAGIVEH